MGETGLNVLDHVDFAVSDFPRSRAFYLRTLESLGMVPVLEVKREADNHEGTGFGPPGRPVFWIGKGAAVSGRLHVAFCASTRAAVHAFHAAALAAGGRDNGASGLRPHYHKTYYSAFVLDPDGHNIEAVCHSPE